MKMVLKLAATGAHGGGWLKATMQFRGFVAGRMRATMRFCCEASMNRAGCATGTVI